MRKYLQITIVLAAFFILVYIKDNRRSDDEVKNIDKPQVIAPTTVVPTETPMLTISGATSKPSTPTPSGFLSKYKDGMYPGSVEDAIYGNLQVQAVIAGGKITDINELKYPNDNRTSISINTQALVFLKQDALNKQSAQVDMVTGASDSSPAFARSLAIALKQATR